MIKYIFTLLSVFILSNSYSQQINLLKSNENNTYEIKGEIIGLEDTSVILAYYFGGKQYATDTAYSENGKFTFSGEESLDGGMYLIVLPNQKFFDIVISEQKLSFTTDLNDLVGSMKFKKSKENTPFYSYLNFITEKQILVTPLRDQEKTASDKERQKIKEEILKIDTEVKEFRENFEKEFSDIFFTKIIKATTEPTIPTPPSELTKKEKQIFQYEYYKEHYWDNMDFTDGRMLRTPVFFSKMDTYLSKMTIQHPDSISKSADVLVKLSRQNKDIFQYVVSYITSTYERSKIMGMDAVFVHMVENYYMTGEVDWVKEDQLKKIEERAEKITPNLIGRPAPPFLNQLGMPFMKDTNGIIHRLYDIESEYTLLIFFGPDCGHCKKILPKVKKVVDSLIASPKFLSPHKPIDIKVYSVQTEFDKKKWKEFIVNQEIGEWINVGDIQQDPDGNPAASSNWRDEYDIYSTPVIYLLDKDKNILAKRISFKQISKILEREKSKKTE
ncbi:MAG: DUF5106 domain-containing protein [Flavobacteriales bacterium]|nr:DUF5106 domain-containing protein [Flavobacteriales bacterium]